MHDEAFSYANNFCALCKILELLFLVLFIQTNHNYKQECYLQQNLQQQDIKKRECLLLYLFSRYRVFLRRIFQCILHVTSKLVRCTNDHYAAYTKYAQSIGNLIKI